MDSRGALKAGIVGGERMVQAYLGDLSDAVLLARAVPGTNHIAWQLGHLIYAERWMVDLVRPGSVPELPAGIHEQHSNDTAASDDPTKFLSKAEYLELFKGVRAGTLALLETLSDAELDEQAPERLRHFLPTVGNVFVMQGTHWVMHAGQWAIIRRTLGKPPLF
jgi:hypothetical protein